MSARPKRVATQRAMASSSVAARSEAHQWVRKHHATLYVCTLGFKHKIVSQLSLRPAAFDLGLGQLSAGCLVAFMLAAQWHS